MFINANLATITISALSDTMYKVTNKTAALHLSVSIHTASLWPTCHHTVLHLPIHTVSLSVITQSFIFPFTPFYSLSSHNPSSSHLHRFTLCHHTVLHISIHTVSLSVTTQPFIFPFTKRHSLSSHSPFSYLHSVTVIKQVSSHSHNLSLSLSLHQFS